MINQTQFRKLVWIGLLSSSLIPAYFFLYGLQQKWIVLSAFTFAFIIANLFLYVIMKRVKHNTEKTPNELVPYLEVMGMGILVMSVSLYTLIGVLFSLGPQIGASVGTTKYYFWIMLCIYVLFAGWKLFRMKESSRYLLIPLSILVVIMAVTIAGFLFYKGDSQAAFGFLILSNMNVMGLWFWVTLLIYLFHPKSCKVIVDFNNPENTTFNSEHTSVIQMRKGLLKMLLIVALCATIKFGSTTQTSSSQGVITDLDLKRVTEPYPAPEKIEELEEKIRRQRLRI